MKKQNCLHKPLAEPAAILAAERRTQCYVTLHRLWRSQGLENTFELGGPYRMMIANPLSGPGMQRCGAHKSKPTRIRV